MSADLIKSKLINKINLTSLFISETIFNDANTAIIKTKIKYFTHVMITFTFTAKSITSHKFNLLTLAFIESIVFKITIIIKLFLSLTSLLIYRFVLSLSLTYKSYKKLCFIIVNLYIHYILLNKSQTHYKITRIISKNIFYNHIRNQKC